MADAYVYYFISLDARTGKTACSERMATLEAIKGRGEPVLESQLEVDSTEVDGSGFLVRYAGWLQPTDELWREIRSLKLRAASRDRQAVELDEKTEGPRKYMLSLESRELRKQANRLESTRADKLVAEFKKQSDAAGTEQFGGGEPIPG